MHVAARGATRAGIADSTQRHVLPRRDTRRNLNGELGVAADASLATTLFARRLDDLAFAAARRARRDRHELAEERTLGTTYFARTRTRRARLRLRPRLGAGAIATIARIENLQLNLL